MFLKNIRKLNVILHISRSKEKNVSTVAEKWFGRIQHPFTKKPQHTRNKKECVNLIKSNNKKTTADIKFNGETLKAFPSILRIRQVCLFLLIYYLFLVR